MIQWTYDEPPLLPDAVRMHRLTGRMSFFNAEFKASRLIDASLVDFALAKARHEAQSSIESYLFELTKVKSRTDWRDAGKFYAYLPDGGSVIIAAEEQVAVEFCAGDPTPHELTIGRRLRGPNGEFVAINGPGCLCMRQNHWSELGVNLKSQHPFANTENSRYVMHNL